MEEETEETGLVMIDSSIFIDHFRDYTPAVAFFRSLSNKKNKVLFSAITETELMAGKSCNDYNIKIIILNMLNSLKKVVVNNQIALQAGDLCRKYGIDLPNAIIAATTLVSGAVLLTKNVSDFHNIPNLKIKDPY